MSRGNRACRGNKKRTTTCNNEKGQKRQGTHILHLSSSQGEISKEGDLSKESGIKLAHRETKRTSSHITPLVLTR